MVKKVQWNKHQNKIYFDYCTDDDCNEVRCCFDHQKTAQWKFNDCIYIVSQYNTRGNFTKKKQYKKINPFSVAENTRPNRISFVFCPGD